MQKYNESEIQAALAQVSGWAVNEAGELWRQFEFANFLEAIAFVNKLADVAEELGHHPDILIRYNRVKLSVLTHDAGNALTELDFKLAKRANAFV